MGLQSWIRRQFKNGVSITDTIPLGLAPGALSFTAADGTTFPDGSVGKFIITVDKGQSIEEKVLVASRSGSVFTIDPAGRGYNGTSPQTHLAGCTIFHTMDQQDLDEANQVAVQTLGAIAAKGDMLIGSSANNLTKVSIGSTAQFWQVVAGTGAWVSFGSGGGTAIAASSADGTSTNPSRYDHTHSGVASINGGTGVLAFTNGNGIVGNNSNPPAPAVSLTTDSGSLGSPYSLTTSMATYQTTNSLAAGTWIVIAAAEVSLLAAAQVCELQMAAGSAGTVNFFGNTSQEVAPNTGGTAAITNATMAALVTIGSPGTLVFQAKASSTTGGPSINSATPASGLQKPTGYIAIRIA